MVITYADACYENVVTAVFGGVVCASVTVDAPIAGERRGNALSARTVRVAIEEGEIGRNEVGSRSGPHRKFRIEMI